MLFQTQKKGVGENMYFLLSQAKVKVIFVLAGLAIPVMVAVTTAGAMKYFHVAELGMDQQFLAMLIITCEFKFSVISALECHWDDHRNEIHLLVFKRRQTCG
jgi:hypothetical protein